MGYRDNRGEAAPESWLFEVIEGKIPNWSGAQRTGLNPDIDLASGYEHVWGAGGLYTGFNATVAEPIEVLSSDPADTLLGTGARTIEAFGLDQNFDSQSEVLNLNGTSPSAPSGLSYIRSSLGIVRSAGSGGGNAGTLTVRQSTTTANVFMTILPGYNRSMVAAFTVPNGKTGFFLAWFAGLARQTGGSVFSNPRMLARPPGECFQVLEEISVGSSGTSMIVRPWAGSRGPLPAQTDIVIAADASANDTAVTGAFTIAFKDTGS